MLRDPDLNREPRGYEPRELPLLYPAIYAIIYKSLSGAGERNRTAISSLARTYNNHYMTPATSQIDKKIFILCLQDINILSGYLRAKVLYILVYDTCSD